MLLKDFIRKSYLAIILILCGIIIGSVFFCRKNFIPLTSKVQKSQDVIFEQKSQKIPKIIHYCWFGPKKLGPLEKKCIKSWKKYLPDYEIMEWNDSHLHLIDIPYVKQAYNAGKYAFVADVFRLYALEKYGGIYMDTDTEVLKNLDEFLSLDFFCGFENWNEKINPALTPIGAIPNHHIIKDLYVSYLNDDTFDYYKPINERFEQYLQKKGVYMLGGEGIIIEPGAKIFPYNYFINYKKGISYARHHYRASWSDEAQPKINKIKSFAGLSFWLYEKVNIINDEFIWNKNEKVLFKILIGKNKYFIITNNCY